MAGGNGNNGTRPRAWQQITPNLGLLAAIVSLAVAIAVGTDRFNNYRDSRARDIAQRVAQEEVRPVRMEVRELNRKLDTISSQVSELNEQVEGQFGEILAQFEAIRSRLPDVEGGSTE